MSAKQYERLLYEKKDGVAKISFNNPNKYNAIDWKMAEELQEAFSDVDKDDDVRVVVLTGVGDRAFCTGADLSVFETLSAVGGYIWLTSCGYELIRRIEKPIIARVSGYCLAGGLEYALACDFIIASEDATFGVPEINSAIIPSGGGTIRLPRAIPSRKAKELLFTGERISAKEAERLGLVNRVVPGDKLDEVLGEIVEKIKSKSPFALKIAKKVIDRGLEVPNIEAALTMELLGGSVLLSSEDCKEGVTAFKEKRKAVFKGK
ncbi:MAG: enoyl-CoA hydratase/isomerase family protein [Deltaproteobacteria bacterium]|nr:enoyl-CoA hydratase/isomerase family protein [Deltaproteobacteria bacterium]